MLGTIATALQVVGHAYVVHLCSVTAATATAFACLNGSGVPQASARAGARPDDRDAGGALFFGEPRNDRRRQSQPAHGLLNLFHRTVACVLLQDANGCVREHNAEVEPE